MLEGLADLLAQQGEDVGRVGVREVGRGDFEHQLADRVGAGGEFVDDTAPCGERGIRRRVGGRRRWCGADVPNGLADHRARRGLIEGLEAAVSERGKSAGDQSSATSPLRPETTIRARWDRP
ncbi:hypothetical protein [Streptomyces coeruleorubidus]|uniref:hypothetical protein n=1 Tax=Streptomyces coeruleorubidus TaxID=116188 RepID=UPI00340226BA